MLLNEKLQVAQNNHELLKKQQEVMMDRLNKRACDVTEVVRDKLQDIDNARKLTTSYEKKIKIFTQYIAQSVELSTSIENAYNGK